MARPTDTDSPCPCGRPVAYADCCAPLHAGAPAANAEALMRSRYTAYVRGDVDYLLATWHPDTRPPELQLYEPGLKWLGLEVKQCWQNTADDAGVEFVARFRVGGDKAQRLHERSRFVREEGRWFYLDEKG